MPFFRNAVVYVINEKTFLIVKAYMFSKKLQSKRYKKLKTDFLH